MRITREYRISAENKCSVNKVNGRKCTKSSERRRYTHVWKENLNNDY